MNENNQLLRRDSQRGGCGWRIDFFDTADFQEMISRAEGADLF